MAGTEYSIAARNTPFVGYQLAMFLYTLNNHVGINYANMTLIGHSMGAHIAGIAGNKLGGVVGKIYGLDPAGPHFTESWASRIE